MNDGCMISENNLRKGRRGMSCVRNPNYGGETINKNSED